MAMAIVGEEDWDEKMLKAVLTSERMAPLVRSRAVRGDLALASG